MTDSVDALPAVPASPAERLVDRALFAAVVAKHLGSRHEAAAIPFERDLFELGLDSLSAARLLLELERTFGIEFPEARITVELFASAATLEQAVVQLIAGRA